MAVIDGTNGVDTLTGTSGNDEINALGGDDVIMGSAGADALDGGTGTDTVDYSTSAAGVNVEVRFGTGMAGWGGDAEGDTLTSIETVIGSAFNDTFAVGPDHTAPSIRLEGGAGDDIYYINNGATASIVELADGGNDEIRVSVINPSNTYMAENIERLTYVGSEDFTGWGNANDNILTGNSGNDTLYGGAGADQFIGGAGYDTAGYTDSSVAVNINLKTGVHSGIGAGDTFTDIEAIKGSNYDDTFVGDGLGMDFDGGAGTDTVDYSTSASGINVEVRFGTGMAGGGGDAEGSTLANIENVIGSAFNDTFAVGPDHTAPSIRLEGGAGDDIYYINNGATASIVELADGGNDEIRVSVINPDNTYMAENIERLTYVGSEDFTGWGNASNNILAGGSGNDILYGGSGNDTLYGGAGADQFIGGAGYDTAGYTDSTVAMTINLKTGVYSGIGADDTFTDIEAIKGSSYNDIFYGGTTAMGLDGAVGQDLVSYELSDAAVTIDLTTNANAGDAAGDTFTNIELFQGSNFDDTLSGSQFGDVFIGGAGADVIDGRDGQDSAMYITSASAVNINLLTGVNQGGDAQGDVLLNIERVVGSHFNDTLTGDANVNYLEGGLGNDLIYGGDGNDYLYGGLVSPIGPFTLDGLINGPQADTLYGGNGNDTIVTAGNDEGSQAYGEAGGDVITVIHGMADGGDGDDLLTGMGSGFSLFGGAGDDKLVLQASGSAFGGEGDDTYNVNTSALVTIQDDGVSGSDKIVLSYISSAELLVDRVGNDLYLHRSSVSPGEVPQEGVQLKDWFAGSDTIEQIQTADGQLFNLPASSDGFAMFG